MDSKIVKLGFLAGCIFSGSALAEGLSIYFIDVEQADSTLIVSPSGKTLLIDSGKNFHGKRIKAVMEDAGVDRIDHYVTTHYHEDHYGGIDDVVDMGITVIKAYDRGDKTFLSQKKLDEPTYKDYQAAVGSRAKHLKRGRKINLDPDMTVTAISSGGVVKGELNPVVTGHHENDMSISLLIQYGDFSLFVGGDIESHTEQKIADRDLVMDVDIYISLIIMAPIPVQALTS